MAGDPSRVVGRRLLAYLLDSLFAVLIFYGGVALLGVQLETSATPGGVEWEGSTSTVVLFALLSIGYWVATAVVGQGLLGWTPGKLMLGIRLVGWDGRPPGLWRAFVHSFVVSFAVGLLSCLGGVILLAFVVFNRYHRHPGDMLAGTYVIDAWSMGRMMIRRAEGLEAGPPAVTRADVVDALGAEAAAEILREPQVGGRPTQPVYDKALDTYVVWRTNESRWMAFDKTTGQWRPLS